MPHISPFHQLSHVSQETFDLRGQARWKLENELNEALAGKHWDAVGVAAFALGELLGMEDPMVAAGSLMLHQVTLAAGVVGGGQGDTLRHTTHEGFLKQSVVYSKHEARTITSGRPEYRDFPLD